MSTKSLRKLVEMFGGVPLNHYTTEKMDREAHEAWAGAKAELEAIEGACLNLYLKGGNRMSEDAAALLQGIGAENWTPTTLDATETP